MKQIYDLVIVGAGIVGLASAYQLLRLNPKLKILILEKESFPASHQTGRNSGVVHSGIYYKPGSSKAKNCIEGRQELLQFCESEGVPYLRKHKLIVATSLTEKERLSEIFSRGSLNGVANLKLFSSQQVREIEPNVNALQAIYIPECHILNYAHVAQALVKWVQDRGVEIAFDEPLLELRFERTLSVAVGKNKSYLSRFFINCAGLNSDRIALQNSYRILPFRGEYYELVPEKRDVVKGLIYPVPDPQFPFLGVHLTPRIDGTMEAGPNAILALAREGYRKTDFNWRDVRDILSYPGFWKMAGRYWKAGVYEAVRSMSKQLFLRDLRRLVPSLELNDLRPGGAGVRAQVVTREGKLLDDFAFLQEEKRIHVINAPSPAATASFAIGRIVGKMAIQAGL